MDILTVNSTLHITGGSATVWTLKPHTPYVVPSSVYDYLIKYKHQSRIVNFRGFREAIYHSLSTSFYTGRENLNGKRIIVFRHGGIGDLIFITPCLAYLKTLYPTCHITFATSPEYHCLFESLPYIDSLKSLPLPFSYIEETIDFCINLEGVIEDNPEAEEFDAYKVHRNRFFISEGASEVFDYLPEVSIDREAQAHLIERLTKDFPMFKDSRKVVIAPFASVPIRTPDPLLWINFLAEYPWKDDTLFFLVGTSSQQPHVDSILQQVSNKVNAVNFISYCGGDLKYTVSLIEKSSLVVAPDSGAIHLAGALGTNLIGLYGAFPSKLRLNQYKKGRVIGIDAKSSCRYAKGDTYSCFQHGGGSCKAAVDVLDTYPPCMYFISHNHIYDAIKEMNLYDDL